MKPCIIYKPAFTVIGFSQNGDMSPKSIDSLWDKLAARYDEIPHADPDAGYGVHTLAMEGHHYLAGLSSRRGGGVPPGMTERTFDPHTYAVFPHAGRMVVINRTMDWIFSEWLPSSGYQFSGDYYFEYFDDRFQPDSDDSLLFIYLPVYR